MEEYSKKTRVLWLTSVVLVILIIVGFSNPHWFYHRDRNLVGTWETIDSDTVVRFYRFGDLRVDNAPRTERQWGTTKNNELFIYVNRHGEFQLHSIWHYEIDGNYMIQTHPYWSTYVIRTRIR